MKESPKWTSKGSGRGGSGSGSGSRAGGSGSRCEAITTAPQTTVVALGLETWVCAWADRISRAIAEATSSETPRPGTSVWSPQPMMPQSARSPAGMPVMVSARNIAVPLSARSGSSGHCVQIQRRGSAGVNPFFPEYTPRGSPAGCQRWGRAPPIGAPPIGTPRPLTAVSDGHPHSLTLSQAAEAAIAALCRVERALDPLLQGARQAPQGLQPGVAHAVLSAPRALTASTPQAHGASPVASSPRPEPSQMPSCASCAPSVSSTANADGSAAGSPLGTPLGAAWPKLSAAPPLSARQHPAGARTPNSAASVGPCSPSGYPLSNGGNSSALAADAQAQLAVPAAGPTVPIALTTGDPVKPTGTPTAAKGRFSIPKLALEGLKCGLGLAFGASNNHAVPNQAVPSALRSETGIVENTSSEEPRAPLLDAGHLDGVAKAQTAAGDGAGFALKSNGLSDTREPNRCIVEEDSSDASSRSPTALPPERTPEHNSRPQPKNGGPPPEMFDRNTGNSSASSSCSSRSSSADSAARVKNVNLVSSCAEGKISPVMGPLRRPELVPLPSCAMHQRMERIAGLINQVQNSVEKQEQLMETTRSALA